MLIKLVCVDFLFLVVVFLAQINLNIYCTKKPVMVDVKVSVKYPVTIVNIDSSLLSLDKTYWLMKKQKISVNWEYLPSFVVVDQGWK